MTKVLVLLIAFFAKTSIASELDGIWVSDCYTKQTENGNFYITESLIINNDNFERKVMSHEDSLCRRSFIEEVKAGIFNLPGSINGLRSIDLISDTVKLKPQSDRYIEYFNDIVFCGFNDWTRDGKEVLGGKCFGQIIGAGHYDVYEIEDHVLFLGDQFDKSGTSLDFRPIRINRTRALRKK